MSKSMTIYEKPTEHLSLPNWYSKQWELKELTKKNIDESFDLRNSSVTLRNETKIQTEWDLRINNSRINDRIKELNSWYDLFGKLLNKLINEKIYLQNEKNETEKILENIELPLQIISQCISMRDCRRSNELTYDEADTELKNELTVIENAKKLLNNTIYDSWNKLNKLEEVKFELDIDYENKLNAIKIDNESFNLNKNSSGISYKPNSMRISKNSKTYSTWIDNCKKIKNLVENELQDAYSFREAMIVSKKRTKIEIEAQQDTTDYSLRKRIFTTQQSRNEMEWQKNKIINEMDILNKEINKIDESIKDKNYYIKCAETRLENRTYRPGFELCRDETEYGLNDEIIQLRKTKQDLIEKFNNLKTTYNGLESLLIKIQGNLDDKQHSMMTDIKCLDIRATLKRGDRSKLPNETDRNIVLTQLEKEIPLEY